MDVTIVIPTYNEKENLQKIVSLLLTTYNENNIQGEILIIDDNSPDGTGHIADKLSSKYNNIRVIHRKGKLGLGSSQNWLCTPLFCFSET